MSANIGWLFYRDYYAKALELESKADQERHFAEKNEDLLKQPLPPADLLATLELPGANAEFALVVAGAGLLVGTGYTHETGLLGELKMGFYFDHTTGLPLLPGSSVKGILRSVFPGRFAAAYRPAREQFLRKLLAGLGVAEAQTLDLAALEAELFDNLRQGQPAPPPERDVFGDAYPTATPGGGALLASDFITPHRGATKNPDPLGLLRIRPGVTMGFRFRLTDGLLTAAQKKNLFEGILLQVGVGAKTRVGFGRLQKLQALAQPTAADLYQPAATLSPLPKQRAVTNELSKTGTGVVSTEPKGKPTFFAVADAPKYRLIDGAHYFVGTVQTGVLLEAVASIPNSASPKMKRFSLLIGDPAQPVFVSLQYADNSIVGKPCCVKVATIDKKTRRIQTIEFKKLL